MLRRLEPALDQAFDFAPLVRPAGPLALMIPPVVTEQQMAFALGPGGQVARSTGRVYEITQDARLAGGVPDWRTYLLPNAVAPKPPPDDVRPRSDKEAEAWRGCVARGWAEGEALAVTTYLTGLGAWQQLMVGAARGLVLADRGLVRMARVTVKRVPVQGGGRMLRLDDAEMRVTGESTLERGYGRWRPTPEIAPGGPIGTLGAPQR
jgi:defect-in-organelle-trafficking protein DotC